MPNMIRYKLTDKTIKHESKRAKFHTCDAISKHRTKQKRGISSQHYKMHNGWHEDFLRVVLLLSLKVCCYKNVCYGVRLCLLLCIFVLA